MFLSQMLGWSYKKALGYKYDKSILVLEVSAKKIGNFITEKQANQNILNFFTINLLTKLDKPV